MLSRKPTSQNHQPGRVLDELLQKLVNDRARKGNVGSPEIAFEPTSVPRHEIGETILRHSEFERLGGVLLVPPELECKRSQDSSTSS